MAKSDKKSMRAMNTKGQMGFVLFVAYIGAAVYFVQQSYGFGGFIWALLKAAVWPAYIIHAVLGLLNIK